MNRQKEDVKCTMMIAEVRVKYPKNNVSHVIKVFLEYVLWEFVIHVYNDILH